MLLVPPRESYLARSAHSCEGKAMGKGENLYSSSV